MQIIHQLRGSVPDDSVSTEPSSARSRRLQRFLSLMDEKEDVSRSKSKRMKTEGSSFDGDEEMGRSSKRRETGSNAN